MDWIKKNAAGLVCIAVAAGLLIGCSFLDPAVPVPAALREHDKTLPAEMPLSKAIPFLDDARGSLERRKVAYAAEIERDAQAIVTMGGTVEETATWVANLKAMAWQGGKEALTAAGSAVPGLGLVIPALFGLGGLLINKPGTSKVIKKVEAQAYTQGFNERAELEKTGKLPVDVPVAEVLVEKPAAATTGVVA